MAKKQKSRVERTELPIEHVFGDEWQYARHANHITIQFDGSEYYLSFFEINPPLLLGTPAERQERIASLDAVEARCVSRLVISAGRMREIYEVIKEHVLKNSPVAETD